MVFGWNPTRPSESKQPSHFWPVFKWALYEIPLDHANWSNLFNFDSFWMVFVWNPTGPRKSKQSSQFWLVFEWSLYEILLDHVNRSNLLNFNSFLKGLCMKSYQIIQIEATFSILTRFWMVFLWNPMRPRKSKRPFQIWLVFEWFLYEIVPDDSNRSNLLNFDSFPNGFCMKSYLTQGIEATFSILTRFWMVHMKSY